MMMAVASYFLILAVLLADQTSSFEPLVRQLGSPIYQERELAGSKLEEAGPIVLPALKAAKNDPDLEVRTRVAVLAEKVESAQLTKPTMISLDYQGVSLKQVFASINKRHGTNLLLAPDFLPIWESRVITIENLSEPLPFWKAVDRLSEAGGIHVNPTAMNVSGRRDGSLSFSDNPGNSISYVSDSGPFRVSLAQINFTQNVLFGTPNRQVPQPLGPDAPVSQDAKNRPNVMEQFNATLQLMAEPRLVLQQRGIPRVTEAFDDRGQSLTPRPRDQNTQRFAGYMGMHNNTPVLQLQVELSRPKHLGSSIRRMRGVIPISVSMRRPDPIKVPVGATPDKLYANEEVALSLGELKQEGKPPALQLSIRPIARRGNELAPGEIDLGTGRNDLAIQQRLEVVDAEGHLVNWYPQNLQADAEVSRITIMLTGNGQVAPPAEIRYYGMISTSTDVPFSFENIALE